MLNFKPATHLLPILAVISLLSACTAGEPASPVKRTEVKADAGANRYVFSSEKDPERGEVVKIFDQQTGDYWIKWVGTDQGRGAVYSVWNFFPLEGEPKSGLTRINTLKMAEAARNEDVGKKPVTPAPANGADPAANSEAGAKSAD